VGRDGFSGENLGLGGPKKIENHWTRRIFGTVCSKTISFRRMWCALSAAEHEKSSIIIEYHAHVRLKFRMDY